MTPEQVKELVERLENGEDDFYCDPTDSMERHWPAIDARFREAASALSLLAQEREELREALNSLVQRLDAYMVRVPDMPYREFYQGQHDEDDSELNRARAALKES